MTVGKKSGVDPVFRPAVWLTGNLLIDRDNRAKAHGTIAQVAEQFKRRHFDLDVSREGPAAAVAG